MSFKVSIFDLYSYTFIDRKYKNLIVRKNTEKFIALSRWQCRIFWWFIFKL